MKKLDSKTSQDDEEHKNSPSARTVDSSDDLLREIFRRLGLKQLARLKRVSKRWNFLTSEPDLLPNRLPKPADGLICSANRSPPFFSVPFEKSNNGPTMLNFPKIHQPFSSIEILHACNGLLVFSGYDKEHLAKRYFVLNPTTMKSATLPDLTVVSKSTEIQGMCMAFDPSTSPHYKVVCVSGIWERDSSSCLYQQFEVYSSETRSWRIRTMETFRGNLDINKGVYWNGALHWISNYWNFSSIYFSPDDDGDCRVFPPPPTPRWSDQTRYSNCFGESFGHLHFVIHSLVDDELTVYEMRRDYSEWFVKYKSIVDLRTRGVTHASYVHFIHALVWGEKDEDRFLVFHVLYGGVITRYSIVSETFETLHDNSTCPWSGVPLPYFESTCCV